MQDKELKRFEAQIASEGLECLADDLEFGSIEAVAGSGEKIPTFKMTAYTGGLITKSGDRIVIDVMGMSFLDKGVPIRLNHDISLGVGHTTMIAIQSNRRLVMEGVVSRDTEAAREVVASAKNGFPWEASIGVDASEFEFIPEKTKVTANGRSFTGPLFLARKSTLNEVSFVDKGANDGTKVRVAAQKEAKEINMPEDNKKKSAELEDEIVNASDKGTEDVKATVEATPKSRKRKEKVEAIKEAVVEATADASAVIDPKDHVAELRKAHADEVTRINAIRQVSADRDSSIEAEAVEKGWSAEICELAQLRKLRENRPNTPSVHIAANTTTNDVLSAAICTAGGLSDVEAKFSDESLQKAHTKYRGSMGLQELLLEAAWANGYTGRMFKNPKEILQYAFGYNIQAGVSLIDISGILGDSMNKFMLEGFFSTEQAWREIASTRPVSDFKTITSYRLIGKDQYELLAPGGTIKHGNLGEESYQNKADTYGLLLKIDRRDIINDDMSALTTVPRKLGRGSALKINDIFWTVFLANAGDHFHADNNNLETGAGSALDIDAVTASELAFANQVDTDGKPLGLMPKTILVPPALKVIATSIFKSELIHDASSANKLPQANPFAGQFPVVTSSYLSNSAYTGNSAVAWYMLADARDLSTIEVVFLNGQESPTIESADVDFNALGIQMRGYHDFGVRLQDPKAGVRNAGS